MSGRNEKVAAMLAAEAPAARDLAFEIAVLARIERRRFARNMARNLAVVAAAALLLALIMPQLDWAATLAASWSSVLSQLTAGTPVLMALLVAGFAAWYYRPVDA
jgi:hypothetical protein